MKSHTQLTPSGAPAVLPLLRKRLGSRPKEMLVFPWKVILPISQICPCCYAIGGPGHLNYTQICSPPFML